MVAGRVFRWQRFALGRTSGLDLLVKSEGLPTYKNKNGMELTNRTKTNPFEPQEASNNEQPTGLNLLYSA